MPLRQPSTTRPRPLAFVDVDGVLNPDGSRQQALGYRPHRFDGVGPDGQPAGGIVWLHPDHGAWLANVEAAGGQPVWATSWDQLANTWIAPRLNLPDTWPVVDLQGRSGVRWGHTLKLEPLTRADIDQVLDWLADPAVHTASPHAQVREHDCQAAGTLEYVAMYGAAGFGQAWQCTACGRGWARLGEHFHPAEEGAHLPSPEDNALTTRRPG